LCYAQSMPLCRRNPCWVGAASPTMRRTLPPKMLLTHELPLEGYREAVQAGLDKNASQAMKVVFRTNG